MAAGFMAAGFMAEECPQNACVYIPDGYGSSETCGGSSGARVAPTAFPPPPPPLPVPPPSQGGWAATFRTRIRPYEFGDSSCVANGGNGDGDPITLVIRARVDQEVHLAAHGLTIDIHNDPIEQIASTRVDPGTHFYDNGLCGYSEILRGSTEGHEACVRHILQVPFVTECLRDRLHLRGHTQSLTDPQYPGLFVTATTPHWDLAVDACDPIRDGCTCDDQNAPLLYRKHINTSDFWHDGSGVSGFSAARDILVYQWLTSGSHMYVDVQEWDNIDRRHQCNGDDVAADGNVVMLGTCGEIAALPC
jgi:hypothetical protein